MDRRRFIAMAALPALYPLRGRAQARKTEVTIRRDAFHINGRPTYAGRTFNGKRVEGLLMNIRAVQGIFDDLNPETAARWVYPDTKRWIQTATRLSSWRRCPSGNGMACSPSRSTCREAVPASRADVVAAARRLAPAAHVPRAGRPQPAGQTAGSARRPLPPAPHLPAKAGERVPLHPPPQARVEAVAVVPPALSSRTAPSIRRGISGPRTWRGCSEFSTGQTSSGWWRSSVISTSGRTSA